MFALVVRKTATRVRWHHLDTGVCLIVLGLLCVADDWYRFERAKCR